MNPAEQSPAVDKPKRRKSEKRQRGVVKGIRFLEDEFNAAAANASAAGMSFGAYVRAAATGNAGPRAQRRLPVDAQLLRETLGQIGRVGNNVNQLAYQANAHDQLPMEAELRAMRAMLDRLADEIMTALGKDTAGLA